MSVPYNSRKANVVADGLIWIFMGIVTHVVNDKKKLVKEVHRLVLLSIRLKESLKAGFMVWHNYESCLVVKVKSKQHLDPLLMDLNESVLKKSIKNFSKWKSIVFRHQWRLCVPDVDVLRETIL